MRVTTPDGFTVEEHERGGLCYFKDGKPWPAEDEAFDHVKLITALAREIEKIRG